MRPGVDQFMKRVGELYEVVIFTAAESIVSFASPPAGPWLTRGQIVCQPTARPAGQTPCGAAQIIPKQLHLSPGQLRESWFCSPPRLALALTPHQDLSRLGRDLKNTIIIDNSPCCYLFHPQLAVPITSWYSDALDKELLDLIPVLEDLSVQDIQDVSLVLDTFL